MWLTCFSILVAILLWQAWSAGPARALGVVVVLSLLIPTWVVLQVAGLPVHMRVATGIVGLGIYCIHPQATINWRLGIVDLLGLALFGVHVLSDWTNDGFSWSVPVRAYGEWAVPYLAGRLALQSMDDVRQLLPFVLTVSIILASISVVESLTGINLEERAFGNRPVDQFRRDASRLGLKRAYGPTMHPIYLGSLQALLFPWTLYAASRARRAAAPKWWKLTPWIAAAGVFFTMSRAPVLAVGVTVYITALITTPYRKLLVGTAAIAIVAGVVGWQSVLDALHLWGGGLQQSKRKVPTIKIGERELVYSGTLSRIYLFDVYGLAMQRASWLGFGTDRTTGFPVNVPVGQQHTQTLKRLPWIDNAYILLILRFGYLGVAIFILFGIAAITLFVVISLQQQPEGIVFSAAMAGALTGIMLLLLTVWMPHDFGVWYLWSVGTASGLCGRNGAARHSVHSVCSGPRR